MQLWNSIGYRAGLPQVRSCPWSAFRLPWNPQEQALLQFAISVPHKTSEWFSSPTERFSVLNSGLNSRKLGYKGDNGDAKGHYIELLSDVNHDSSGLVD